MSVSRTARLLAVSTTVSVGLGTVAAIPASAGDEMTRRGACSGSADWRLEVRTDGGRIEVEGEVDSSRGGQRWRWRILHDGHVSARGAATTEGGSGSFDVERRVTNAPGPDRIGWRAWNRATGQRCRGGLSY